MSLTTMSSRHQVGSTSVDRKEHDPIAMAFQRNLDAAKSCELWRACFAEFAGSFSLAFFTIGVGISKEGTAPVPLLQVALGTAFFISVVMTSLGTVSGGHVNPAISIGFLVVGEISFLRFVLYSVFQTLGCLAGSGVLYAVLPQEYRGTLGLISKGEGVGDGEALVMEIVITALLLFITISLIDQGRNDIEGSVPYMIGLTVGVNVLAAGKISGGCMNPARAFGPAIVLGNMESQWIYWLGPLLGGVLGALLYDLLFSTCPLGVIATALNTNASVNPSNPNLNPNPNPNPREPSQFRLGPKSVVEQTDILKVRESGIAW